MPAFVRVPSQPAWVFSRLAASAVREQAEPCWRCCSAAASVVHATQVTSRIGRSFLGCPPGPSRTSRRDWGTHRHSGRRSACPKQPLPHLRPPIRSRIPTHRTNPRHTLAVLPQRTRGQREGTVRRNPAGAIRPLARPRPTATCGTLRSILPPHSPTPWNLSRPRQTAPPSMIPRRPRPVLVWTL